MIALLSAFNFIKSPIGMLVIGAVAFAGWTTYSRYDAARDARIECEAKHATAALKEIARQDKVIAEAQEKAEKEWQKAADEIEKLKELRNDILETETDSCTLPDDLRERLSDIQ